jgi:hypothetical protein
MKLISVVSTIQFYVFGAIAWITGAYTLFEMLGLWGLLLGFTPLGMLAPIYHLFVRGFDQRTMIWIIATVLFISGMVIAGYANDQLEKNS